MEMISKIAQLIWAIAVWGWHAAPVILVALVILFLGPAFMEGIRQGLKEEGEAKAKPVLVEEDFGHDEFIMPEDFILRSETAEEAAERILAEVSYLQEEEDFLLARADQIGTPEAIRDWEVAKWRRRASEAQLVTLAIEAETLRRLISR